MKKKRFLFVNVQKEIFLLGKDHSRGSLGEVKPNSVHAIKLIMSVKSATLWKNLKHFLLYLSLSFKGFTNI